MWLYTLIWWSNFLANDVYLSVVLILWRFHISMLPARNLGSQDDRAECNQVHNILIDATWNHQLKVAYTVTLLCEIPKFLLSQIEDLYLVEKYCPFSPFFERKLPEFLCLAYWSLSRDLVLLQLSCSFVVCTSCPWTAMEIQQGAIKLIHLLLNLWMPYADSCWSVCDVKQALFWNGFSSKEYLHFCLLPIYRVWSHKLTVMKCRISD